MQSPAPRATPSATPSAEALARKLPPGIALQRTFVALGGQVSQWRLDNGLRVVLLPDAQATTVAFHTWVAAGSAHERPGETGAAHLLEHLMFKATETQPGGAFDRLLESFGASANAATWLDWTSFHEVVLPDRVTEVAALEADRLHRIRFEPVGFAAELDVVRNERRETVDDDPDARMAEALYHVAYGGHAYGHPTIGWQPDLARMNIAAAQRFYKTYYQPGNVWLVVVGAVDPATLLPALMQCYGPLPAGSGVPPMSATPAPKLAGVERTVRIEAETDRLLVGWRTVGTGHADHPALTVLVEVLANAASARVTDALVHRRKVASHVDAELPQTAGPALLELQVELVPGKSAVAAKAALGQVLTELQGPRPVTDAEVAAARNRLTMARYATLATVDGRADALGLFATVVEDPAKAETWWRAVQSVTAADVQRVARQWLVPERQVVLLGRHATQPVGAQ